ncbi:ABC-2 type transport system permease protein [Abditibacterium utsteinense]|uniref:ABC-2 type transport system permease protein n=1 Tax=Abditibacterium utsteinense TaxID=1960156 RepID=A0A2S8SSQ2_9BACT|nr:ABC transporter permease [Abditibacterium utsteinense]PQV63844.1 ABC-2 type transport system permease protein [Abditibacterium utsteinense]
MNDLPSYSGGFTVVGGVRESTLESLREIWRFRPLIAELVRRDLKVRYKNRVGGILWSLFPPLMQVFTITLMVNFFLSPVEGYATYLMPVMFLWQFFQNCVLDASQSMVLNAQLVRKIYFPRAILPIVTLLSNLLHFGISLGFTLLYFFVKPWPPQIPIYPQHLHFKALMAIPIILGVATLAIGIGYLLAYLNTLYDDLRFLTTQFLLLFLYALPIFYPIERVAARPAIYPLYMLNPMATWMVAFQRALLPPLDIKNAPPVAMPWFYIGIAACSSLAILIFGFINFERSKWTMMERL